MKDYFVKADLIAINLLYTPLSHEQI